MEDQQDNPMVSVILCTYSSDLYEHFVEAARSVLNQTYEPVELVIVVDGEAELLEKAVAKFGDRENVIIGHNETNQGLSASRNRGIGLSSGDIIAFIDDDAVADDHWLEELVAAYRKHGAKAVGGRMTPRWVDGRPSFLPEEFYWLVGVTHRGFPERGWVRNTFGSNISFKRDALEELGGFKTDLGRRGETNLQGEETELASRMHEHYGQRVWYEPDAMVSHKVFGYRTRVWWLLKRAFWQGYSKRAIRSMVADSGGQERAFLRRILFEFAPRRLGDLVRKPSTERLARLVGLLSFTVVVGSGYLYAKIHRV